MALDPYSKCRSNDGLMKNVHAAVPLQEPTYIRVLYVLDEHALRLWLVVHVCVFTTEYLCVSSGVALMVYMSRQCQP